MASETFTSVSAPVQMASLGAFEGSPALPAFQFLGKELHLVGSSCYGHEGPTWSAFFYEKLGGSMPDLAVYNVTSLTGLLGRRASGLPLPRYPRSAPIGE